MEVLFFATNIPLECLTSLPINMKLNCLKCSPSMSQAEKLFIQFHPSHGCSYQYFLHGKLLCSIVSQRTVFLQTRDAFHFGTVVFTKKKKKKNLILAVASKRIRFFGVQESNQAKGISPSPGCSKPHHDTGRSLFLVGYS